MQTQTALVDNVTYASAKFTSSSQARPSPSLRPAPHLSLMLAPRIGLTSLALMTWGKNEEKWPRNKFLEKSDTIFPQTF